MYDDRATSSLGPRGRSRWWTVTWVGLAVAAIVFAGLPGHVVPWFSGDIAYHIGVSRSVELSQVSGFGPYRGLPSYYGGTFALLLRGFGLLSMRPEVVLAAVSWLEPAAWVACAWYLAAGLWPGRRGRQVTFAVLLLASGGFGSSQLNTAVNAPNIAGQVFWPLYPRDIAIMLSLVCIGAALRGRWVLAGIACGLAISTQVQVALFTSVLMSAAFVLVGEDRVRNRVRNGVLALGLAVAVSTWWWIPRVVWVLHYGSAPQGGGFAGDVSHRFSSVASAYGFLPVLALAGLVIALTRIGDQRTRFLLAWAAVVLAAGVLSLVVPSELLSFRRSLLLAAVPLAALATLAVWTLCELLPTRVTAWGVALLCVLALAPSVPTLVRTRSLVHQEFAGQTIASFGYPDRQWSSVWGSLADREGEVLAPPRDASVAWFQTGRPVASAIRPGYIKTWFDVGRATGWSEADRQAAVQRAFSNNLPAMCALMRSRRIDRAVLRSVPGMVGVVDYAGAPALSTLVRGGPVLPQRNGNDNFVQLTRRARVVLDEHLARRLRLVQVWQPGHARTAGFGVRVGGRTARISSHTRDGDLTRFDVVVPKGDERISLVPLPGRRLSIDRVVGYRSFPDVDSAPATVLSTAQVCGSGGSSGE